MSLMSAILVLIVVGIGLWLVNRYIPMDGKIKTILNVVVVIAVVLAAVRLRCFGPRGRTSAASNEVERTHDADRQTDDLIATIGCSRPQEAYSGHAAAICVARLR